ncbi:M23 family metallopeptidase [Solilutibacter tolerans]|uniref:Peptidase family M23 n=1 Tax=Solilutibacter tolerans TaxID=1604334 RepID=A0A1N6U3I7_9GAMM|nr:M23 family metallopeptidase [Lysobacter tolerans]SIQ60120.1 Peptidase family M23 [Lysobacter tolerans]
MSLRPVLLLLLAALLSQPAQAQWLSWPPKPTSPSTTPADPPAAAVRLRLAGHDTMREIWVDNDLSGPVEVRIDTQQRRNGFPLQQTLPGRGGYLLGYLPADTPVTLRLTAVPGLPAAHAQGVSYRFPLLLPQVRIGQAPEGRFSHVDVENRQAIDFAAPLGTPVIAARAGTVMQLEDRFGNTPGQLDEANFVRILHADGSMAIYAHLERGSIEVLPGQRVETGQVLARSGNSGYSSGPHLHFAVQVNRGMRLESVPVRIETASGELRLPRTTAQP